MLALLVFGDAEVTPNLSNPQSPVVPVNVHVVPTELRAVRLGGGIELTPIKTDWHVLTGWEDKNFLGGLRRLTIDMRPGVVLYPTSLSRLQLWDRYLAEGRANAELRQPGSSKLAPAGPSGWIQPLSGAVRRPRPRRRDGARVPRSTTPESGLNPRFGPLIANIFYNFQTSFPFAYGGRCRRGSEGRDLVRRPRHDLDLRDDRLHPHKGLFIGNDFQFAGVPVTPNFRSTGDLFPIDLKVQPEVRGYIPIVAVASSRLPVRATTGFLFPSNYASVAGFQQAADVAWMTFSSVFSRFLLGRPQFQSGLSFPRRGLVRSALVSRSRVSRPGEVATRADHGPDHQLARQQ